MRFSESIVFSVIYLWLNLTDVDEIGLVWWTPFTGNTGSFIKCGYARCFITQDRKFQFHPHFGVSNPKHCQVLF